MLKLPNVTFLIIENRFPEKVKYLCDYIAKNTTQAQIIVKDDLPLCKDKQYYDKFCALELHSLFTTPHAIVCQLDGYPINWQSWDDIFLDYDYIGAPWIPNYFNNSISRVGNGGFSLRSRRLCQALSTQEWISMSDDVFICQHSFEKMCQLGMRYAPPSLAARFSIEHDIPEKVPLPFGFHDPKHPRKSHPYNLLYKTVSGLIRKSEV